MMNAERRRVEVPACASRCRFLLPSTEQTRRPCELSAPRAACAERKTDDQRRHKARNDGSRQDASVWHAVISSSDKSRFTTL